jgi:DNA helicase IV
LKQYSFGVNYRQTREVGLLLQELHEGLFDATAAWQVSDRLTGSRPRVGRVDSLSQAAKAVASEARRWRQSTPNATVAVLYDRAMTPKALDRFRDEIEKALVDEITSVRVVDEATGGGQLRETDCVVIASVRQTKGLEFDAVVFVSLRSEWANSSPEIHPRVRNGLYVAASRARAGLSLCMRHLPEFMNGAAANGLCELAEWHLPPS